MENREFRISDFIEALTNFRNFLEAGNSDNELSEHIDYIHLKEIIPYILQESKIIEKFSFSQADIDALNNIEIYLEKTINSSKLALEKASASLDNVLSIFSKFALFEFASKQNEIVQQLSDARKAADEIIEIRNKLIEGTKDAPAPSAELDQLLEEARNSETKIEEAKKNIDPIWQSIEAYESSLFGGETAEGKPKEGGKG